MVLKHEVLFSFEGTITFRKCGEYSEEVPPVPVPNTVVKLLSADDTWGVTPWEIRTSQVFFLRPHGQVVKTSPFHGGNPGSSPGGVTTKGQVG